MSTTPLLELKHLKLLYGGISAVKGIDLYINAGELVTLIGANGAGKTTTLKVIAGLLKPSAGSIQFLGHTIGGRPAYELAELGIGLVPEGRGGVCQDDYFREPANGRIHPPGFSVVAEH